MRKFKFTEGGFFHVFNKSIANYGIFKDLNNGQRFIETLDFYNNIKLEQSFSKAKRDRKFFFQNLIIPNKNSLIKFITYCVMPDHYHLLVKMLKNNIFSKYINDVENSFTRYFNIKFKRKGPLWQSEFKATRIETDEQLLHVTRYIHLNPTTNLLVKKPEDWSFSSYKDYINNERVLRDYIQEISIRTSLKYKKFVENQIDYQKKLKQIKKLIFD